MRDAGQGGLDATTGDANGYDGGGPQVADDGAVIPIAACTFEQGGITTLSSVSGVSPDDPLAVSVRNDGASLVWVAYESGKRRVSQGWFTAENSDVVTVQPFESSTASSQTDPTLAATSNGYLTVWADDLATTNNFDLRARSVDDVGNADDTATQVLTADAASDLHPALATGADGNAVVVYQTDEAGLRGHSLLLGADGKAIGAPNDLTEYASSVGRPALARLGDGYLLAWVDSGARHVHLQRLDARGAANGASYVLDYEGSAQGTIDLATTDTGGAAVWDVYVDGARAEIRLRTFDLNAAATGNERVLTDSPDTGLVPAIAPLRGGYAVAYRSLIKNDFQLELALVDRFGGLIARKDLARIVDPQVPVALGVSPDGQQLFLSWIDRGANTTSYQLQRTWIHCD